MAERMRRVAKELAGSGGVSLEELQQRPDARTNLPFLFDGGEGSAAFLEVLQEEVNKA